MKITYAGSTDRGLVRHKNEDAILMCANQDGGLFLVADGIGGLGSGEEASALLKAVYLDWWNKHFLTSGPAFRFADASEELRALLKKANGEIYQRYGEMGAGSTLALLYLSGGYALILSSGDSRIYRARGLWDYQQLTTDDVYENFAGSGVIEQHLVGKLVAAVGIQREPLYRMQTEKLKKGDRFLLCSDGIYRFVPQDMIRSALLRRNTEPQQLLRSFQNTVRQAGAGDNLSLIYVRVEEL